MYSMYFVVSVFILAALLIVPVSHLIWVMSVRRLQSKTGQELSQAVLDGQKNRARFIAVFLSLGFSYLFNLGLMGTPGG